MNVEGATERALVLRAQSGDRGAFDELLRSIQGPLYGYIAAIVPGFAEDILQDVFILILRKLRWLNDPSLFRAWAYRIASREAFRKLKKQRSAAEDPIVEIEAPETLLPDPWIREKLLHAAGTLPPASRAVVLLHYFEEMPLAEIAAVLDLNLGTVKSRLAYGLAQLRKDLV
jgi:RNA polymerase sigma-70 factor (ECF subfamily)